MSMKPIPKGEIITDAITKHLDRNYLTSLDLAGHAETVLTIDRLEKHKELVYNNGNKDKDAILCYFKETPKPLKLCKTNIAAIIQITGTNIVSEWAGKKIKLAVKIVKAFGDMKPAVRVIK